MSLKHVAVLFLDLGVPYVHIRLLPSMACQQWPSPTDTLWLAAAHCGTVTLLQHPARMGGISKIVSNHLDTVKESTQRMMQDETMQTQCPAVTASQNLTLQIL